MTIEEFDNTKWYKGIRVRDLMTERELEVDGVDFKCRIVSFWGKDPFSGCNTLRVLPYQVLEIVEE